MKLTQTGNLNAGFFMRFSVFSAIFSSACITASNRMRFPSPLRVSAASAGALLECSCNCIKTAPRSGRARRGKHCALAVVLILFFQRLCAS
ncbi:hypothetical protein HEO97_018145 [Escherichia coli]|nr:hypothetical protein [Escherichia coli]